MHISVTFKKDLQGIRAELHISFYSSASSFFKGGNFWAWPNPLPICCVGKGLGTNTCPCCVKENWKRWGSFASKHSKPIIFFCCEN